MDGVAVEGGVGGSVWREMDLAVTKAAVVNATAIEFYCSFFGSPEGKEA